MSFSTTKSGLGLATPIRPTSSSSMSSSPATKSTTNTPMRLELVEAATTNTTNTVSDTNAPAAASSRTTARRNPRRRGRRNNLGEQTIHCNNNNNNNTHRFLYVLPVLLLEFLALALTRAVLPSLLLDQYGGDRVYLVLGCADFVRGLLAFAACPWFGKVSDLVGRQPCLLVTVIGTCAPVCSLALFTWQQTMVVVMVGNDDNDNSHNDRMAVGGQLEPDDLDQPILYHHSHPYAIHVFVVLLALSGVFSSTFTLVFCYISDTVHSQDDRVSAYGLALATFGLSFTMGPILGGYLAQTSTPQAVFVCSFVLTLLDVVYIVTVLPESLHMEEKERSDDEDRRQSYFSAGQQSIQTSVSLLAMDHKLSWNPVDTVRVIATDPFLRQVGKVAFLYYTGMWAVISTLSVYAVQRFHWTPERLGELISVLGLCTMLAEAGLVRIMVPWLGETRATKLGLASFALQCVVLGLAYEGWHLFLCAACSLLGNLVYPSLTSLVSGSVEPDAVGEALGAINGIKALTEGIGPLVFGSLMTISEASALPGWPYLLAALLVIWAYHEADALPDIDDDDYIHELEQKPRVGMHTLGNGDQAKGYGIFGNFVTDSRRPPMADAQEELQGLLSDVEE